MQSRGFRHELLEGEFAGLILSVDDPGEEEGRGKPEGGAEGHEDHDHRPRELDGVHDLLVVEGPTTD